MAGPELVLDVAVIGRTLVGVFDVQGDRRAGGSAFEHSREDADEIGLAPLGGEPRLPGLAAVEMMLQIGFAKLETGRDAVDDTAYRRPVAFAPGRHPEDRAETVAGHAAVPMTIRR
jgi:hypothetical protein